MTKYNKFVESLKLIHSKGYTLRTYTNYLLNKIVDHIKSTDSYKQFQLDDIKSCTSIDIPNINIYDSNSDDELTEYYISLDIKKANFTSMCYFYPGITLFNNKLYNIWEEFIKNFTDVEFFINSKPFSQIVFNKLNNKKNSILWKKICYNMYQLLKSTSLNIIGKISDDELIIKTNKYNIDNDISIINKILFDNDNSVSNYWKLTPYYVKYIARTGTYQKFYGKFCYYTNKCELKGCEKDFFAQLYKQYNKIELCDNDLKTMINDFVVTFDEPLEIIFN